MTKGRIALFFVPFSLKIQKRRNHHLKEVLIIAKGEVDFDNLTEEQEQELMRCLLKCFVKLHEEEKEGGEE